MQDIFGQALLDYQKGDHQAELTTETNISEEEQVAVSYFFRDFNSMPALEQKALQECRGKILDVGSGSGSHSLWLQGKGMDVRAIDISPGAIQAARLRGVKNADLINILDLNNEQYDTLLMLMNGSGIMESLEKTPAYLRHLKSLLTPGGQILIDSSDLRYLYPEGDDGAIWIPAGRYYGEVDYWLTYQGVKGDAFPMLYLDATTLEEVAHESGLQMEILLKGDHYDYLARLSQA